MEAAPVVSLEDSIFVVSGGAGGITAAVVRDLAATTRGSFYLSGKNMPDRQGRPGPGEN